MADANDNNNNNNDGNATTTTGTTNKKKTKRNKKAPVDDTFYKLLEVEFDATEEMLKKAYRRKALVLHPDKGGDPAKFHEMKKAYDVLNDPQKRKLYDQYGPEILEIMDGQGGPEAYVKFLLKHQSKRLRLVFTCLFSIILGILVCFPILCSLKWDNSVTYSWAIMFIPFWVFQSLLFLGWLGAKCTSLVPEEEGDNNNNNNNNNATSESPKQAFKSAPINKPEILCVFLLFSLVTMFEAFFSTRLDFTVTWNWFGVFAPLYFFESILVVYRIHDAMLAVADARKKIIESIDAAKALINESPAVNINEDPNTALHLEEARIFVDAATEELRHVGLSKYYFVQATFWPMIRFITYFLLAARAQGEFTGTWFLTAIPIIVGSAIWPCIEAYGKEPNETSVGIIFGTFFGSGLFIGLLTWLLGMGKMDNNNIYSAFAVFGPYFVVVGFIVLIPGILFILFPEASILGNKDEGKKPPPTQPPTAENDVENPPVIILSGGESQPTIILGGDYYSLPSNAPPPKSTVVIEQIDEEEEEEGGKKSHQNVGEANQVTLT